MKNYCQYAMNSCSPYVFLFLISSVISVLKMTTESHQYDEIVLALLEQSLVMKIESNQK
jgi:hypothetical protein